MSSTAIGLTAISDSADRPQPAAGDSLHRLNCNILHCFMRHLTSTDDQSTFNICLSLNYVKQCPYCNGGRQHGQEPDLTMSSQRISQERNKSMVARASSSYILFIAVIQFRFSYWIVTGLTGTSPCRPM